MTSPESTPILSIIIPTRNRPEYAISAIRSALSIASEEIELIVQDNSDGDELSALLAAYESDGRLRYQHTKERLDVIANFNKALDLARGEYFTFIGDDDGVNPEILDAVRWAKQEGLDALTPTLIADYFWPDMTQKYYGNKSAGNLRIRPFNGSISFPNVEQGMRECARNAGQNLVHFTALPKVYYGIVKRACMEKVREKTGTYFPGVSPDMSGAMAAASYVQRLGVVDYPLFVPGSSIKSTAGSSARKQHLGRLQDQPHLPHGCWDHWPDRVPSFFAVQTVWAQSLVRTLEATDRYDVLKHFNTPLLHAMCAVFNPPFFRFTLKSYYHHLSQQRASYLLGTLQLLIGFAHTWWLRIRTKLQLLTRWTSPKEGVIPELPSIEHAVEALTQTLATRKQSFLGVIGR
ncbi:Spore coat polysaccharide biosynthesis protein SpsA [compost metagenome]